MISDEKQTLRAVMRQALDGWSAERRRAASAEIAKKIAVLLQAAGVRRVFGYAPLADEPDWRDGIFGRIPVALPRAEGGRLVFCPVDSWDVLGPGPFGALEPVAEHNAALEVGAGDAVLVPGLAFDGAGRRLGRGGGYYDRFLAGVPPGVLTVGVVFSPRRVDAVPAEAWDIPVADVVSDSVPRSF